MLRVGTGTSAEGFGIDSRFGEDRYEWRLVLSAGSRVGVRRAEPKFNPLISAVLI